MPEVEYARVVHCPPEVTWDFIKDMNKWGKLLPGYQKHEVISDTDSVWWLKGDLGILARIIQLRIHITEWIDAQKVTFVLEGLNEPVDGEGAFLLVPRPADPAISEITLRLKMQAGGMMGPLVNSMMKPMLRPVAEDFAKNIADQLENAEE